MPKYTYRAYTPGGLLEERIVPGDNANEINRDLVDRGYRVVSVRVVKRRNALYKAMPSFFKVRNTEIYLFCRQLATFVRAGLPITEGIRLIAEESGSVAFRLALDDISEVLDRGESFSDALARHPKIFNQLFIDMVRAAELSGNLDEVLLQVATYLQRQDGALKKLKNALIYPAVVFFLAVTVSVILIVFVLPTFVTLFEAFHAKLPLPTRILIAIGNFGSSFKLQIALFVVLAGALGFLFLRSRPGRIFRDRFLARTPIIGTIVIYSVIERFARTLSTMLKAGIPIGQTFDVAIAATGNTRFQRRLDAVRQRMVSGEGFSTPLESTGLFPGMVIRMIKVGEQTGTLDHHLEQVADFYAEENEYKIKNMIAMIEPALVVAVGLIVGFIGIAVIMPMYGLLRSVVT
ncbi:MAG: type II secretion system F family protein [Candidatus Dormibacteria bacterium]